MVKVARYRNRCHSFAQSYWQRVCIFIRINFEDYGVGSFHNRVGKFQSLSTGLPVIPGSSRSLKRDRCRIPGLG